MASTFRTLTIDCRDPYALAQFWQEVLEGYAEDPNDPNNLDDPAAFLQGRSDRRRCCSSRFPNPRR